MLTVIWRCAFLDIGSKISAEWIEYLWDLMPFLLLVKRRQNGQVLRLTPRRMSIMATSSCATSTVVWNLQMVAFFGKRQIPFKYR